VLPARSRVELDLEIHIEPLFIAKKRSSSCLGRIESPVIFPVSSVTLKRAEAGFGLRTEGGGRPWHGMQTQESPSSYELTSPSPTRWRALHAAEAQQATSRLSHHAISDNAGGLRNAAGKGRKTCTGRASGTTTCRPQNGRHKTSTCALDHLQHSDQLTC
jgi:hypothetical protein